MIANLIKLNNLLSFQDMFVEAVVFFFGLFSTSAMALYFPGLPLAGPVAPYIGSIPALANAGTSLTSALNSSLGGILGGSKKYSNGFFWPPPPGIVASVLEKDLLGLLGLQGLGLGGLGLSGLGIGGLGNVGLLESGLGLGLTGGLRVIRIPLSSSLSAQQQCPAPCFICLPQTSVSSIHLEYFITT